MSDTETVETTDAVEDQGVEETEAGSEESETVEEDPTAGLKKALQAERRARREAEQRAKAIEASLADRDKEPAEQAIEQARREAREEAQNAFNERIKAAELKAALAGKVSDINLALKVIDMSAIDVDGTGSVDPQSVTDAIEEALTNFPVLAPAGVKKFTGTADQGARGKQTGPAQITRDQLSKMTPEQIDAAFAAGQLDHVLKGT